MSLEFVNPKIFAKQKRKKKFDTCRETRRANNNGQTLQKQYRDLIHENLYGISKIRSGINRDIKLGLTSFEEAIGMEITEHGIGVKNQNMVNKINALLSLNKEDNIEDNNEDNNDDWKDERNACGITYDERLDVLQYGVPDNIRGAHGKHINCKRIYLAYYDIEQLINNYENRLRKIYGYNKKWHLEGLNKIDPITKDFQLNKYIKNDNYYTKMKLLNTKLNRSQWMQKQLLLPKQIINCIKSKCRNKNFNNINNNSMYNSLNSNQFTLLLTNQYNYYYNRGKNYVNIKYSASSMRIGCKINCCNIHCFGSNDYWSPRTQFNDGSCNEDYLQVDLGYNYHINAVSTRGRPLHRKTNKETKEYEIEHGSSIEYVKRYKLFVKYDNFKEEEKDNKDSKDSKFKLSSWINLGVFSGNKDSETENCHILQSKNIIARYIRFIPFSKQKDGFHGKKSMRIGVYGMLAMNHNKIKTKTNNKNSKNNNKKNNDKSKNGLITSRNDIPMVIICIDLPSDSKYNLVSKNGYGNRCCDGIVGFCNCSMCNGSFRRQENKKRRRKLRRLTHKWTKLMNVNNFDKIEGLSFISKKHKKKHELNNTICNHKQDVEYECNDKYLKKKFMIENNFNFQLQCAHMLLIGIWTAMFVVFCSLWLNARARFQPFIIQCQCAALALLCFVMMCCIVCQFARLYR